MVLAEVTMVAFTSRVGRWLLACVLVSCLTTSVSSQSTLPSENSTNASGENSTSSPETITGYYAGCPSRPCRNGATCVNLSYYPHYRCYCRQGWTGRNCDYYYGVNSTRPPELTTEYYGGCLSFPCPNGGGCVNLPHYPYYRCDCPSDWSGAYCDEYLNSTNSSEENSTRSPELTTGYYGGCRSRPCLNGATCTSLPYRPYYRCSCRWGWTGQKCEYRYGWISTRSPVTTTEVYGGCRLRPCLNGATCTNLLDDPYYRCSCRSGWTGYECEHYYGWISTRSPDSTVARIFKCGTNHMELLIPLRELSGLRLSVRDVRLQDRSCVARQYGQYARIYATLNSCGSTRETRGDTVVYMNTAYGQASPYSARRLRVPMVCYVGPTGIVGNSFAPRVEDMVSMGSYEVRVRFYVDRNFTQAVHSYPYEVELGDPLYTQVALTSETGGNLDLFLDSCKVSPYPGAPDSDSLFLLRDGCRVDPSYTEYGSGAWHTRRFAFDSMEISVGGAQVYLECSVRVCNVSDWGSRCRRGCVRGRRAARDLGAARGDARLAEGSVDLSQGPIRLRKTREAPVEQRTSGFPGWTGPVYALAATLAVSAVSVAAVKIYRLRSARIHYQPLVTTDSFTT